MMGTKYIQILCEREEALWLSYLNTAHRPQVDYDSEKDSVTHDSTGGTSQCPDLYTAMRH